MHLLVGHDVIILDCKAILSDFTDVKMFFQRNPLKSPEPYICGWLIGCHVQTFNCAHFTKLLQGHPKLAKIPICCKKRPIKLKKDDKPVWNDSKFITAITNDCSFKQAHIAIKILKTIFNKNWRAPGRTRFKVYQILWQTKISWSWSKEIFIQKAINIQKYLKNLAEKFPISGVFDLHFPVDINGNFLTL